MQFPHLSTQFTHQKSAGFRNKGMVDPEKKNTLQQKKLNLSCDFDIERSGETTNMRFYEFKNKEPTLRTDEEINALKVKKMVDERIRRERQPNRR